MQCFINRFLNFRCPRWEDFPDIGLYMDQVVSFIEQQLGVFNEIGDNRAITSAMINNYVKQKIIAAPNKKRYCKEQTVRLYIICLLKRCFNISEINDMMQIFLGRYENRVAFNLFGIELENSLRLAFDPNYIVPCKIEESNEYGILEAVLRAFSNKLFAQTCITQYNTQIKDSKDFQK